MIENEDTNKEEEIEDLTIEEEIKDFTNSIKIDGAFNYPTINSPTITGGAKLNLGSGNKCFKFQADKGIWLGHTDYASAPFKVDMDGAIAGSSFSLTSINGDLDDISDGTNYARVVKANLDTSAKTILGDFTFSGSGALKMITDANNGLWFSPTGILAKKAGATTFAIGIDGSPTFVGTITGSAITGGTIQTAASGRRVRMVAATGSSPTQSANSIGLIDSDGNLIWSAGSEEHIIQKILPKTATDRGLVVQTLNNLDYTAGALVQLEVQTAGSSTGGVLYLTGYGSGITQEIMGVGGTALKITKHTDGRAETAVEIGQYKAACLLDLNKVDTGIGTVIDLANAGTGKSIYAYQGKTTNANTCVDIWNKGTGRALNVLRDSATSNNPSVNFVNSGGGRTIEINQSAAGNSNSVIYIGNSGDGKYIDSGSGAHLSNAGVWTDASSPQAVYSKEKPQLEDIIDKIKQLDIKYKEPKKGSKIKYLAPKGKDLKRLFNLGDEDGVSATTLASLALLGIQYILNKE